jgi:hypothetical protein
MGRVPSKTLVKNWLTRNSGICVCDECIAQNIVGLTQQDVRTSTVRLGHFESGFSKYRGRCEHCGTTRRVTIATLTNWLSLDNMRGRESTRIEGSISPWRARL